MHKTPELFDDRNDVVKNIEFNTHTLNDAKVGEFWRYYEGVNIGNEISKDGLFKRPCLVLQNNMGNGLVFAIPLTTKFHIYMNDFCVDIRDASIFSLRPSRLILNQCKLIDKKRLIGKISERRMSQGFITLVVMRFLQLVKKSPIARIG